MQLIRSVIDWLLYTSVFAALCALSLCGATERLILGRLPQPSALHMFIAGSTLLVYNAHHLIRKSRPEVSDRYRWTVRNRKWHLAVFISGLLLFSFSIFSLNMVTIVACIILGILSFGYTLPVLPFMKQRRLRDHGWIKIVTLTMVWTIATTVLPMLYHGLTVFTYPLELMIRAVFMFTLCVAFDVRDMQTDLRANIYTVPNIIGVRQSYRLMSYALVVFVLLSAFQYFRTSNELRLSINGVTALATAVCIHYSRRCASDRYYLGAIDGMMLLYGCLVAFFGHY